MNSVGFDQDIIVAVATPPGVGAIAMIRLSGAGCIELVNRVWRGKNLIMQASHTLHVGYLHTEGKDIDEVVIALYRAPKSYTKEDVIEITCHGSPYITQSIVKLLIREGARYAKPGEYTLRAFLQGRFGLDQAEAVADLIHSDSEAARMAALHQLRGGFHKQIKELREKLVHFASLIELELDFAEEDVEFASRSDLQDLVQYILDILKPLVASFDMGNALKEGIPTVIIGKPNAGKSTLLNALFNEEKALVSPIEGTTRDVIEDELFVEGMKFRIIDTAGLRATSDTLEAMGIAKTKQKIEEASLVLHIFDVTQTTAEEVNTLQTQYELQGRPFLLVANKCDSVASLPSYPSMVQYISAQRGEGLEELKKALVQKVLSHGFKTGDTLITNLRHYQELRESMESLDRVMEGLTRGTTGDLMAEDIRAALHHLGLITGQVTTDDLLDNIFSKFCIGK